MEESGGLEIRGLAGRAAGALRVPLRAAALASLLCATLAGCRLAEFGLANASDAFAPVERHRDIKYGTDPRQRLDVYEPQHGARHGAVVVFWYGGSWVTGDKNEYRFVGIALAERGFVAVVPDYRLYPQVTFPAFDADGARAVAWVEQHAREYGGDPGNIVLMGHSAGGQIAAMLAFDHDLMRAHGADPACISGLVGLSGTYVLVPDTDELRRTFAAPYTEADWQPVRYVDSDAPPTLLLHGLADREVLPREAQELRDALQRKQVRVELRLYPRRGHGATVASFAPVARGFTPPALRDTVTFIQSLKPTGHCS
jgi:acetyl esterase/lipase